MIFYFTGTGNSKFIADKIGACLGEKTVDIGVATKNNEYSFDCSEEQNIGFVFPTYGFCMPNIVSEFITNMELDNLPENAYVFAVNNCGSIQGRALYDLNKKLMDKNITLNYCRSIVFPDNYIVMYSVPEDKEIRKILRSANIKLANVINNVLRNKNSLELSRGVMTPIYKVMNLVFVKFLNGTKKFNVNNECVGCGMCADICNSQAIEIKEGKPVWIKESCSHCMACISRCPKNAIEYGSKTEGKVRYVNPLVKFDDNYVIEEDLDNEEEFEITDNQQVSDIINDAVQEDLDIYDDSLLENLTEDLPEDLIEDIEDDFSSELNNEEENLLDNETIEE